LVLSNYTTQGEGVKRDSAMSAQIGLRLKPRLPAARRRPSPTQFRTIIFKKISIHHEMEIFTTLHVFKSAKADFALLLPRLMKIAN
jgi:hypothetical protein